MIRYLPSPARRLLTSSICLVVLGLVAPSFAEDPSPAKPTAPLLQSSAAVFEAAQAAYEEGNWEEALQQFQVFEKNFIYSKLIPNAVYFQGWCLFQQGKFKEAIERFHDVLKRFPDAVVVPEAKLKLAETYREIKDFDQAVATYRAFQKEYAQHPLMPQAMLGESWIFFKQENFDKAVALAQRVRTRFARNLTARLDALFLLAQIYNAQEKFDDARAVYDEIKRMRYNPRATEALFLAGESMYEDGESLMKEGKTDIAHRNFKDAISYYQRVQSKDSLKATLNLQIEALRARIPKERDNRSVLQAGIESLRKLLRTIEGQTDLRSASLFRVANCYQSVGRPEEASVVYRHFLRLYPDDPLGPQAQFGLIEVLTTRGQPEKAKFETEQLEKNYPDMAGKDLGAYARFLKGKSDFDTGQFAEARKTFTEFLKTSKEEKINATAAFYIAACDFSLKDFTLALSSLQDFITKYPTSDLVPNAKFQLGRAHFELYQATDDPEAKADHLAKAAAFYEEVRASDNKDLKANVTFQLAYVYSYLGAFDETAHAKAADVFQEYVTNYPGEAGAAEALYQLARSRYAAKQEAEALHAYEQMIQKFPDSPLAPFAMFETAVVHGTAKRTDEMIVALPAYIAAYPAHDKVGDAYYAIGQQFESEKKFEEALTEYLNLARFAADAANPNEGLVNAAIGAQLQAARILEGRERSEEALQTCEDFLKTFSEQPSAARAMIAQIAGIYARAKQHKQAYDKLAALAQEYIQVAPIRIAAYTSMIDLALAQKDNQTAYEGALKLLADPDKDSLPAPTYLAVANALMKVNQYADARTTYQALLAKYPDDERNVANALVGLGQASLEMNDLDGAQTAFVRVVDTFPNNPVSLDGRLGLGKVYEAKGELDLAIAMYDPVLRAGRPGAAEASFHLGMLAYKRGDYKSALSFFARLLLSSGPMAEEAAFRSGQCHKELKNIPMAERSFKSYIGRYPEGRFVSEAREELESLPKPQE